MFVRVQPNVPSHTSIGKKKRRPTSSDLGEEIEPLTNFLAKFCVTVRVVENSMGSKLQTFYNTLLAGHKFRYQKEIFRYRDLKN